MMANQGGAVETGYFITSIFVVSGIAFPIILQTAGLIKQEHMVLSIIGGLVVYASMTFYSVVFGRDQDAF